MRILLTAGILFDEIRLEMKDQVFLLYEWYVNMKPQAVFL